MKYYLSFNVLNELVYGRKETKEIIKSRILDLLKKDSRLFTSVFTVEKLTLCNLTLSEIILREMNTLCDRIFPVSFEDLKLALGLRREYSLNETESIDLVIALKNCDFLLGFNENLKSQKLIPFISLGPESKINRL